MAGPLAARRRHRRRFATSRSQRRGERVDLQVGQVCGQRVAERAGELAPDGVDARPSSSAVSGSPSQPHSTVRSLWLDVEGDAVVDAVAVAVGHLQDVPALAVGVVDDDVEDRHPAQRRGVLVDQRDRLVVAVDAVEDVPPAVGHLALGDQRHRLLVRVGLLPELHHARAVRPVAQPGRGDDVPAERLGDEVRRAPRGRRGCRRGSPTAAAPPRPACRRPGRRRSRRGRWRWRPA